MRRMPSSPEGTALDADLQPVVAVLAEISDTELHALIAATYGAPQTAPGLLAWIEDSAE